MNQIKPACRDLVVIQTENLIRDYIAVRTDDDKTPQIRRASYEQKLIAVARQVEERHTIQFDDMCKRLSLSSRTVYDAFFGVVKELFSTGINWGRIGAFFAFGGALASSCRDRAIPGGDWNDKVASWMIQYSNHNLIMWMENNGGWVSEKKCGNGCEHVTNDFINVGGFRRAFQ